MSCGRFQFENIVRLRGFIIFFFWDEIKIFLLWNYCLELWCFGIFLAGLVEKCIKGGYRERSERSIRRTWHNIRQSVLSGSVTVTSFEASSSPSYNSFPVIFKASPRTITSVHFPHVGYVYFRKFKPFFLSTFNVINLSGIVGLTFFSREVLFHGWFNFVLHYFDHFHYSKL